MEKKYKEVEIYIADDGKEFIDERSCQKYEKSLELYNNIRYFQVLTGRDCTETGRFMRGDYYAVYIELSQYTPIQTFEQVLNQFLYHTYGIMFQPGVQGYGILSKYEIIQTDRKTFEKAEPIVWGGYPSDTKQYLISDIPIEGFTDIPRYPFINEVLSSRNRK